MPLHLSALDIGLSTKCVVIPKEMGMCQKIGYSEMRLPNLMGHTSMAEVIQKSTTWQHLAHTDCHPHVRTFLCSLFAPICLDTFIHPCRSMCVAVRDSCAPVLLCHGHSWPASLDCDRFPGDEDTCLAPLTKDYKYLHKGSSEMAEGRVAISRVPGDQGDTRDTVPRPSVIFAAGCAVVVEEGNYHPTQLWVVLYTQQHTMLELL
uniref:FZ domain-containing protein n=1 Tax=Zosterops lateralis melanops TaxID=1220523 RepID=A0A8D2PAR6_ZOSLA